MQHVQSSIRDYMTQPLVTRLSAAENAVREEVMQTMLTTGSAYPLAGSPHRAVIEELAARNIVALADGRWWPLTPYRLGPPASACSWLMGARPTPCVPLMPWAFTMLLGKMYASKACANTAANASNCACTAGGWKFSQTRPMCTCCTPIWKTKKAGHAAVAASCTFSPAATGWKLGGNSTLPMGAKPLPWIWKPPTKWRGCCLQAECTAL